MNSCNFVGRLTADPELRRTGDGTAVCSFTLAVKRPMVKDTTDFINFVSWRQSAEYLAQYGHRGDVVAVSGQLQVREWQDKDGNKRKAFEVITTGVELLSSKKDSQASNNATQPQNVRPGGYSGPQQGFVQPQQTAQSQYNQQGFQNLEGFDGQLPF